MRVSNTSHLCGLWSSQKYVSVPHIQEEQEISIEDYEIIVTKKNYTIRFNSEYRTQQTQLCPRN